MLMQFSMWLTSVQRATSKMHKFKPVVSFGEALKWGDESQDMDITIVFEVMVLFISTISVVEVLCNLFVTYVYIHFCLQNDASLSFEANKFKSFDFDEE